MVHDAHSVNPSIHWMLVHMKAPEYPVALGVIREWKVRLIMMHWRLRLKMLKQNHISVVLKIY